MKHLFAFTIIRLKMINLDETHSGTTFQTPLPLEMDLGRGQYQYVFHQVCRAKEI